jgi:hypothetical protein
MDFRCSNYRFRPALCLRLRFDRRDFGDVVDAVRDGAAQLGVDEVVDVDEFGRSAAPPFPALFLKLPTNSFFFVSTEMTGSFAARNALACVLM